ncbi:unnamed protein product [Urochloa decumbens]|uniref:GDSL esterase/lipase n=1 Tax=Urochloa decumbens TaxID=240449 RepID=A0ABC9E1S7_9POAL
MVMRSFVLCLVISMDVLGAAAAGVLQPPPMYVFGDSSLDVGNNNYLPGASVPRANMSYYGIDFPGVPTGRFSNGDNIADFVGRLLVSTALEIGVSYASGGSGILDCTNAGNNIPLSKQVQYFNATRAKMVAAAGDAAVAALLARRTKTAAVFNAALNNLLAKKQKKLPGLVYSLADSFSLTKDIFADPHASEFTDITGACCGTGLSLCLPTFEVVCSTRSQRDHHVFWDPYHFSQRACFLTAQAFYNGPAKYTTPINFMRLVQSKEI